MLGILFIYFIGRYYYLLAGRHQRNQWGYAIFGIASYYIGTFIGGLILYLLMDYLGLFRDLSETQLGFLAFPFGILSCILVYKGLKRSWETRNDLDNSVIDQMEEISK